MEYFTQSSLTVHGNNFHTCLQNKKSCKVIVRYLDKISQLYAFDNFSQTAHTDENAPNATGACVKKLYRK